MKSRSLGTVLALALTLCGCSSFESRWNAAPSTSADGGPLQAVLIAKGSNDFSAYFHAGWGKRSGTFQTPIQGSREGDTFRFTGSKRVFGVKIKTSGAIQPYDFNAFYDSRFDSGTFTLKRP
jgi:hypothetical protein